jgi:hypothetical protein
VASRRVKNDKALRKGWVKGNTAPAEVAPRTDYVTFNVEGRRPRIVPDCSYHFVRDNVCVYLSVVQCPAEGRGKVSRICHINAPR